MPANIVRPGTEEYWNRAKAQAKKQGHDKDWPYVVSIYQQMTKNKSLSSERGEMFQKAILTPDLIYQRYGSWAGQVPGADKREMQRMMSTKPGPFKASMLLDFDEPIMQARAIVKGLNFDPAREESWTKFLESTLAKGTSEVAARQAIYARTQEESLEPVVRKAIMQRSLSYYRDQLQKSAVVVEVYTPEQIALEKAEARGGSYHRRVTKPNGKHRYYYDPEKYNTSTDAHVSGEDALTKRVSRLVDQRISERGKNGATLDEMKDLAKKFGAKVVAKCLSGSMQKGGLRRQGKKFYLNDKNSSSGKEEPAKKSMESFVIDLEKSGKPHRYKKKVWGPKGWVYFYDTKPSRPKGYPGLDGEYHEWTKQQGFIDLGLVDPKHAKKLEAKEFSSTTPTMTTVAAKHMAGLLYQKPVGFFRDPKGVFKVVNQEQFKSSLLNSAAAAFDEDAYLSVESGDYESSSQSKEIAERIRAATVEIKSVKGKSGTGYAVTIIPSVEQIAAEVKGSK